LPFSIRLRMSAAEIIRADVLTFMRGISGRPGS
jgi:hypothetical protein